MLTKLTNSISVKAVIMRLRKIIRIGKIKIDTLVKSLIDEFHN